MTRDHVCTLGLASLLAFSSSCGEPEVVGPVEGAPRGVLPGADPEPAAEPGPDAAPEPSVAATPEPSEPPAWTLVFEKATGHDGEPCETTCALSAPGGTSLDLAVYHLDGKGLPVEGALVAFESSVTNDVAKLSSLSAQTDANGRAAVTLSAGVAAEGDVTVTVSVPSDAAVLPIAFVVDLDPKDVPPLAVTFEYGGLQPFSHYEVRLFGPVDPPSCAEVHPDASPAPPTPALTMAPLGPDQKALFQSLPPSPDGAAPAWTVQVLAPFGGASTAQGCTEGVETEPGVTREVEVVLADLPLHYAGTYALKTRMDLVHGLEGTGAEAIATLLELFTNPGKVALLAACDGATGTLGTVCGYLVEGGQPTLTGAIVIDAADAAFLALMKENLGDDTVYGAEALEAMLSNVKLDSTLSIAAEAQGSDLAAGSFSFPSGSTSEVWTSARFVWDPKGECLGAPGPCDEEKWDVTVDLKEVYGKAPAAAFGASLSGTGGLEIAPHVVPDLTLGVLVNSLLESQLLPLVFGTGVPVELPGGGVGTLPPIDSYEDLVATLFGDKYCLYYEDCCEYFQFKIQDEVPAFVVPFVPAACEAAIPAAAGWVRALVLKMGGPLTIGTPESEPCPAYAQGLVRDVTHLGSEKSPCPWDATFALGSPPVHPTSSWFGIRSDAD